MDEILYIRTFGVLPKYRRLGIGCLMLDEVFDFCKREKEGNLKKIKLICLHVQVTNEDAISFYLKYGQFNVKSLIPNYYKGLQAPESDAYLLEKQLL